MAPSSRPTSFASPDRLPAPTPALQSVVEMPRAMDQLAGDLSRQHLEHLDYLERMDQMWHMGPLGPPRDGAGSGNRSANPAAMEMDGLRPPPVDENDDDVAMALATGRDFVLRPPSPDPDAMDLVPLDAAAALLRLPAARPVTAHATREFSTAAPPTPPLLPLSPEALAQPHLAPQHHQVPSSGYDLHSWLATASSTDALPYAETQQQHPNQLQLQLQLEDARSVALSFQARRHYYQSLNRLSRQQQQQPPQQQPSPSMASSTTSAGLAGPATGLAGPVAPADHASDAAATPVTPASLPTEPPLPAWVGAGPLRYRLSAEVAMHCPNLVHSRPRMRRRKVAATAESSAARDAAGCPGSGSGSSGGLKGKGISKDYRDKDKHHREHRSSAAAAAAAVSVATAQQAVAEEDRRRALAAEQAEQAEQKKREDEEAQKGQRDDERAGRATAGTEVVLSEKNKDRASFPDDYRGRDGEPGP